MVSGCEYFPTQLVNFLSAYPNSLDYLFCIPGGEHPSKFKKDHCPRRRVYEQNVDLLALSAVRHLEVSLD